MTEENPAKVEDKRIQKPIKIVGNYKWTWWDDFTFWLTTSFPIWHIKEARRYLRGRFIHKRYIIQTGLGKGQWWDTDSRLLYGSMALLTQYINEEKSFEVVNWDSDNGHKQAKEEMLAIQAWWGNYDKRHQEIDEVQKKWHNMVFTSGSDNWMDDLNKKPTPEADEFYKTLHQMEEKLIQEEEEMMIRLVKVRQYMWT